MKKEGNFFHRHNICFSGTLYTTLLVILGILFFVTPLAIPGKLAISLIYMFIGMYLFKHHRNVDKNTGILFFIIGIALLLQLILG
jgi:hypothetical protein